MTEHNHNESIYSVTSTSVDDRYREIKSHWNHWCVFKETYFDVKNKRYNLQVYIVILEMISIEHIVIKNVFLVCHSGLYVAINNYQELNYLCIKTCVQLLVCRYLDTYFDQFFSILVVEMMKDVINWISFLYKLLQPNCLLFAKTYHSMLKYINWLGVEFEVYNEYRDVNLGSTPLSSLWHLFKRDRNEQ